MQRKPLLALGPLLLGSLLPGSLLLGFACTEVAAPPAASRSAVATASSPSGVVATASSPPGAAPSSEHAPAPAPPWPTAPEAAPPAGFVWRTVHHETVHARVLVPDGAKVESTRDAYGYPRVDVDVDGSTVLLQFDSGIGRLGVTMARTPPTVHGLATEKAHFGPENVTARYRTRPGDLQIRGFAPGVKCTFEPLLAVPEATLARIFTVCASLRAPALGAWRRATAEERSHGGMTDIPAGAWPESALPSHPGSLLRPGKLIARLHLGGLVVSGALCPPSIKVLRELDANEVDVVVEERKTAGGEVWIRRVTDVHEGDRYPGSTTVLAPRGGGCCRAAFVPWTTPPSAAQVDYAIALCDTFRAE